MVESNTVTVSYSPEIPPTPPPTEKKYKCPFCDQTFDSLEELLKHLSEAHPTELAILGIVIVVILVLLYYLATR